ncbi:MAG: UpxY family transcription antiterminator [Prolixibacteraceae bacterium]|nr:UpxY family transcription antiterminator [Prolixibacteraceae bacterium]
MDYKKPVYKWFVIYTKTNREKRIYENLRNENIECFLPLKRTLRQWSDRKKWIEEPLFKCYIFVKVSNKEFFNVLCIPGVIYYVSFGGKAHPVPEQQIMNIERFVRQEEKGIILTRERINKGAKAEILAGPLKGVRGEIVQIHGQSRILIRIESLGYCLHANVSQDEIKLLTSELCYVG